MSFYVRTILEKGFFYFRIMITVNENGFVSAREVHKLLDIKERFSVWFENALDFFENDYVVGAVSTSTNILNLF